MLVFNHHKISWQIMCPLSDHWLVLSCSSAVHDYNDKPKNILFQVTGDETESTREKQMPGVIVNFLFFLCYTEKCL